MNTFKLCKTVGVILLFLNAGTIKAQVVTTFAGKGLSYNGSGNAATFQEPYGVAIDALGNVFVADQTNNKIRKITPAGVVSTFAGSGNAGALDAVGAAASFNFPVGIAIDGSGNLYIADSKNHKIRKITSAGVVSTLAGSGVKGSLDATGSAASFNTPAGVAVDAAGNIYVADQNNNKIRKISPSGIVSTLAGSGDEGSVDAAGAAASFHKPTGLTVDASGTIYVADYFNNKIRKISSSGVVSTFAGTGGLGYTDDTGTAAEFFRPRGVALNKSGTILYVADEGSNRIRKITMAGVVTTFAGTIGSGDVDGTANMGATFYDPAGVAVDASGNVYVADVTNNKIRKINAAGDVTTFAGTKPYGTIDATGTAATFFLTPGIVADAAGNLYVVDQNSNKIRKITPAGVVTTFAGSGASGAADGAGATASFNYPYAIAIDLSGNLYVTDIQNNKIRKITAAGVVSTLAGSGLIGSTDATGVAASFYNPTGIAVDVSGNVYVSDANNNKIRKITPTGVVTTFAGSGDPGYVDATGIAASFYAPNGLAIDVSGNVYVSDANNNRIRKISPAGVVSTFAGMGWPGSHDGTGDIATFYSPRGLALDPLGNLYVADVGSQKIRKITPAGVVYTLAGSGEVGEFDGVGMEASFYNPNSVTLDALGNVYVADVNNFKIRKIIPIPEIKITQGDVELVSGSESYNFGNVGIQLNSTAVTFNIENINPAGKVLSLTGTQKVSITGTDKADFSVNVSSIVSPVAVGALTTFTITFSPLSLGVKTATVTILNDDIDEGTYTFTLTGTGIKVNQTISGLSDITKKYGDASFTLPGTVNSSLALTYTSSNSSVASVTGNIVTIHTPGTTMITASQAGNISYNAASNVTVTLTVDKAPLIITADDKIKSPGAANPGLTIHYTGFVHADTETELGCMPTVQTTANTLSPEGTYPITVADCGFTNGNYSYTFVNGSLTISVSTAIGNAMQNTALNIYPNPTTGDLRVITTEKLHFFIYNLQGVKVQEGYLEEGNTTLSLENYSSGLYMLNYIDSDNKVHLISIIKQ